jgi:DNA-directed RNA polymerase specialized sigma24 family protein
MSPFDSLLAWLDPDRERAAVKYEQIRQRLIRIFTCRGRPDADVLADTTIERVTRKVPEIVAGYEGDPASYFYGVAQKVFLESLRQRSPAVFVPAPDPKESEEAERDDACLQLCMGELAPASRKLILDYYRDDKRAKIDHRRELAEALGIAPNALRIRVHRIRAVLQHCVRGCVEESQPA